MMLHAPLRVAVVFLALGVAGASFAEEGPNYAEPGFFIAVQGGIALYREDVRVDGLADGYANSSEPHPTRPDETIEFYQQDVDTKPSYGLRIGYRWEHLSFDLDADYVVGTISSFNATLDGRWYPWTDRIQPYLLTGLGFAYVSPSLLSPNGETLFGGVVVALRVGVGAEFYITEHVFVDTTVSYLYLTGPAHRPGNNQSFLSGRLGLGYRWF